MNPRPLEIVLDYLRRTSGAPRDPADLDHYLLDRFTRDRDQAAFAQLVQRHGPLVLGVCRRVLHHLHDAEDAFQATFLILARKAATIRRGQGLSSWLYRVAFRLACKLKGRLAQRRALPPQAMESSPADPLADVSWRELRVVLDEELAGMPERLRGPLLLCCLQGKSRDEAAVELGWPLGTLKRRLEQGRELLRRRLTRRGLTVSASLLAMLLAQESAGAAVSAALVAPVLEAAAGQAGKLSGEVVALADSGMALAAGKLRLAVAAGLLLGMAGLVGGLLLGGRSANPLDTGDAKPTTVGQALLVTGRFADWTKESGLDDLLDRHYAEFPAWNPAGMDLVDLHGHGRLDLFLGSPGGVAAVGRNDGKGHFAHVDPQPDLPRGLRQKGPLPYPGGGLRLAHDFDEDGRLDFQIYWRNDASALYFSRPEPGQPAFVRAPFLDRNRTYDDRAVALADLNGDGVVDFLISERGTELAVYFGRGDGSFAARPGLVLDTGIHTPGAIPVDLHGQGRLDLVCRQTEFDVPARRRIYRNDGGLTFTDVTLESGLTEEGSVHGVGDVNRDGFSDLVCVEGQRIEIYLNDGQGRFTRLPDAVRGLDRVRNKPYAPHAGLWGGAVVVDMDNDGSPDVLINGKHFLYVLQGKGDGTFNLANEQWSLPDQATSGVDEGFAFGDVDGDGRLDLAAALPSRGDQRRLGLFGNQVSAGRWLRVQLQGRPGNRAATSAKIRVLEPGTARLIAYEQVAVWGRQSFHSYYARPTTERHFGLGERDLVDVEVEFYPSGRKVKKQGVSSNTEVLLSEAP